MYKCTNLDAFNIFNTGMLFYFFGEWEHHGFDS